MLLILIKYCNRLTALYTHTHTHTHTHDTCLNARQKNTFFASQTFVQLLFETANNLQHHSFCHVGLIDDHPCFRSRWKKVSLSISMLNKWGLHVWKLLEDTWQKPVSVPWRLCDLRHLNNFMLSRLRGNSIMTYSVMTSLAPVCLMSSLDANNSMFRTCVLYVIFTCGTYVHQ